MSLTLSPRLTIVAALVALAAIALAGGTVAVVLPQVSQASSLQRRIAADEARLASAAAASTTPTNATKDAASELFQLGTAMPETADMPGILIQLSSLAARSSVTISSIEPSALVPGTSGYSSLPLTLVIDGKYAGITKFLALMRQAVVHSNAGLAVHGRLFIVNEIALVPSTSSTGASTGAASSAGSSDILGATLQADAFVYGTAPPTTSTSTTTTSS